MTPRMVTGASVSIELPIPEESDLFEVEEDSGFYLRYAAPFAFVDTDAHGFTVVEVGPETGPTSNRLTTEQ